MKGNYSKFLLFLAVAGPVFFVFIYYCITRLNSDPHYDVANNIALTKGEVSNEIKKVKEINIIAVGDMMFGRKVGSLMKDGMDPFEFIDWKGEDFSQNANIIMGNLEGPITDTTKCQDKPYSFRFATSTADFIKAKGFTHLSLANNHSYDCFSRGLEDTKKYLDDAGIIHYGGMSLEDTFYFDEINDSKVAFIGVDLTIEPVKMQKIMAFIPEIRKSVDYIIVNIHWGEEYRKTANDRQVALAHELIDSGVDLIIGHHPHVTEQIETYKGKTIVYSLGNFVFDQRGVEQNTSFILSVTLNGENQNHKEYPIVIEGSQPKILK